MGFFKNLFLIFSIFVVNSYAKDWLSNANFYQIYPVSFKDSDGDGIGDLQGIKSETAYLKGLGMNGVWLSPIMASPMKDAGYDISDYKTVNPMFGTVDDVKELISAFKAAGLYLILDFVPNHTSDEHEWFKKSIQKIDPYTDYYVWHDGLPNPAGGRNLPPNNWVSVFRYSAWQWNEDRQQYYYHAFVPGQPDLNYRNPKVVDEMKNILRYWLDMGIAGFRIDAVPYLFEIQPDENGNYKDEPLSGITSDPTDYQYTSHIYTQDQPETFDMAYQWRAVVDEYKNKDYPRVLLTEAYTSLENILKFYGNATMNGSHVPFNFDLLSNTKKDTTAKQIQYLVENYLSKVPAGKEANWVLGNHDNHRTASRLGEERADLYNILLQTLPGNAVTYQGEELCMPNVYVTWEQTIDPGACNTNETVFHSVSRDPCRTPFPWDSSKNAGFSTADKTWLPAGTEYTQYNVAKQNAQSRSHLKLFKQLVKLHQSQVFQEGSYSGATVDNDDLYAYRRVFGDTDVIILLNYGTTSQTVNVTALFNNVPSRVKVLASSLSSNMADNQMLTSSRVVLPASAGVVVQTVKDTASTTTTPQTTRSTTTSTTTAKPNNVGRHLISGVAMILCFVVGVFM
ncbi:probable maltase [Culicoides brevitarsis]|uniref:probable maltase n=1 Tax=Culicoides brevitarsis TaxID=469753 RepID=UPI00307B5E43